MAAITVELYGTTSDGKEVHIFTLKNKNGLELQVINLGATVVAMKCPDRDGKLDDVVLGFDSLEGYTNNTPYFGALCGRVANRIANGQFSLENKEYHTSINDPPNTLHGGFKNFSKVVWDYKVQDSSVLLTYVSANMEEGFPGQLTSHVTFSLTDENEMKISYQATTAAPTPVNLTSHSYFNLAGQVAHDILDHIVQMQCSSYLPKNEVQIPTGEIRSVTSEPSGAFDFLVPKPIGQDISKVEGGYDHNMCIDKEKKSNAPCIRVVHKNSGRVLEVFTDQPGVQFYTGNGLDGSIEGKNGIKYEKYFGFALEAQNYPDAVNQPNFPNCILHPGKTYVQETKYKFSVE